jgi:hypothetical protein
MKSTTTIILQEIWVFKLRTTESAKTVRTPVRDKELNMVSDDFDERIWIGSGFNGHKVSFFVFVVS